jgi:hypothetical protein
MRKISKHKLQKDKEVYDTNVMVEKYRQHSKYFTVDKEKFHCS